MYNRLQVKHRITIVRLANGSYGVVESLAASRLGVGLVGIAAPCDKQQITCVERPRRKRRVQKRTRTNDDKMDLAKVC